MKDKVKIAGWLALGAAWIVICIVWYLKYGSSPGP